MAQFVHSFTFWWTFSLYPVFELLKDTVPFPTELPDHLCMNSVDSVWVNLFLDSLLFRWSTYLLLICLYSHIHIILSLTSFFIMYSPIYSISSNLNWFQMELFIFFIIAMHFGLFNVICLKLNFLVLNSFQQCLTVFREQVFHLIG